MNRPGNKLRSFVLLLACQVAQATAPLRLPFELKTYQLESGEGCPAELSLALVADGTDQVLVATPTISFPFLVARSGVDAEAATSCRYETTVTITDTELTKTVRISQCPNKEPARQITEALARQKHGVSYSYSSGGQKKDCRYRP